MPVIKVTGQLGLSEAEGAGVFFHNCMVWMAIRRRDLESRSCGKHKLAFKAYSQGIITLSCTVLNFYSNLRSFSRMHEEIILLRDTKVYGPF